MTPTNATETVSRSFVVPVCNIARLGEKIAKLAKRAVKLGCASPVMTVGASRHVNANSVPGWKSDVSVDIDDSGFSFPADEPEAIELIEVADVVVSGEAPRINGWTFAATVDHDGEDNIVRGVIEGYPSHYRTDSATCEHCKLSRKRNETFILRSDAGDWTRVGRSCLKDFLGHSDPMNAAAYAEILAEAMEAAGRCGDESSGSGDPATDVFLAYVSLAIRQFGWVSRRSARERGDETTATASVAIGWLYEHRVAAKQRRDSKAPRATDADRAMAGAALAWALAIGEDGSDVGDFEHNLRAAAKRGGVGQKNVGITAYIVAGYQRAMGIVVSRAESQYVGEIGQRFGAGKGKKAIAPLTLTVTRVVALEGQWGTSYINIMRDTAGNVVTWKTGECLATLATYTVTGTVKAHEEYRGMRQTVLTRCSSERVYAEADVAA